MIIAIDGPSGVGKSTVSAAVARRLQFASLDTGAMYRCVAWRALHDGVSPDDEERLGAIARTNLITFAPAGSPDGLQRVRIGGHDVTAEIRTAEVDGVVSRVSALPAVRGALTEQQRRIGLAGNFVVEGRDTTTVVFPNAEVKIFLTASNTVRAQRRVDQNRERGIGSIDFNEVLADLKRRDDRDSTRANAPLRVADDAHIINSDTMTIDEVIDEICRLAYEVLHANA